MPNIASIKLLGLFIALVLAQVLICNNLLIFGVAVPFVFIYFILVLPLDLNLNILMGIAFGIGFIIDLFSDTLGLFSLSSLILAVCKKPIFYAYMPKEDKYVSAVPSIASMGWFNYVKFLLSVSAVFCFLVFIIELFSFASFGRIILMAASSTIVTLLLLIGIDALYSKDLKTAW